MAKRAIGYRGEYEADYYDLVASRLCCYRCRVTGGTNPNVSHRAAN